MMYVHVFSQSYRPGVFFLRIRFSLAHVPKAFDDVDSVFVMKEYRQ